jgi:1-acyl-sn-glycerol-3-phosphate acyltransferase
MMSERRTSREYARAFRTLYPLAKFAIGLSYDLSVTGQEHIPDGPAVFAANHKSEFDPLFLALAYYGQTHNPIHFLAKKEYFEGGGIDDKGKFGRIVQMLVTKTGQIPVDRSSRRGNEESIAAAVDMLDRGEAVGIFPEGTLVEAGRLGRLHRGVAEIAL